MDLIWGATLTRAVSTATRRFGSNFLSVGRVQSPTLGLIVQRELERRAHVPEPFWEVTATFAHPDGSFTAEHTTDKFWKEEEAKAAVANTKTPARSRRSGAKKNTRKPPTPLNTTAFTTDASSRLGITPSRAMRIAEDLYMDGYISYPRTDNTVYPKSLDLKELVSELVGIHDFKAAEFLLDGRALEPTRGKKETTDHPPIYPTQAVNPKRLEARSEAHRKVYELVARRFLATFSPPMISESTRANIELPRRPSRRGAGDLLRARLGGGRPRLRRDLHLRPLGRHRDPEAHEGQELELEGVEMEGKETPPPPRISQGKLIEMMEERGLGTKATRADIIQKLYDRGYVFANPPEPSETGIAMYKAFQQYVPRMATPEMTAEMEAEMDQIAAGEMTKDQVLDDSRDMLRSAYDELGDDVKTDDDDANWRKFAREVWAGMDQDRILGPCIVCEEAGRKQEDGSPNMLRIIKARKSGKRFVGCQGWDGDNPDSPDSCDVTMPLPQRVRGLYKIEELCSVCERTPRLMVVPWRGRPWKLCLNDDCPSMAEMKRRRAEREAAKAAKEAAEAAEKDAAKADGKDGTKADAKAEKEVAAQASATKVSAPATVRKAKNGARSRLAQDKADRRRAARASLAAVHLARGDRRVRARRPRRSCSPRRWARDAVLVREPGGTAAGERIRELLADPELPLEPLAGAAALLRRPRPADRGSDPARRWRPGGRRLRPLRDSSVAYQGVARGLGADDVRQLCNAATGGLWPDLTLLLWVRPRGRGASGRRPGQGGDRFEAEGIELQRRSPRPIEEIAEQEPRRVRLIDAEGRLDAVHEAVMAELSGVRA